MDHLGKLVLLRPDGQEEEFVLAKSSIILGRATISDIVLADARVSRAHARLECRDDGCTLIDLGSANGIRVNGQQVERAVLAPGDVVELGDSVLRFEVEGPEIEPDTTPINSEAELEATLAQTFVPMTLTNTQMPRLVVHTPTKTWEVPLNQEALVIGRQAGNDLILDEANVSRRHARLERVGESFRLHDLDSTNGTWLGPQRIETHTLQDGETIRIGQAQLVFKSGFEAEHLTLVEEARPGEKFVRQPVVFVPGMMGSELWRGSERVWPNVKMMFTHPDICRFEPDDALEPGGIVGEVVVVPNLVKQQRYSRLGDHLEEALGYEREKNLLEFAYDWRQDNRLSAQRLAQAIDRWPVTPPITLIAHSLGCLVSRYYVERLGGKHKVGRLILLGGPHYGYPKAISHLLSGPDLLPFGLLGDRLRQVISTFPSIYQILPTSTYVVDQTGQAIDLFSDETWLPENQRPLLRNAAAFRRELGAQSSVPTVSIFGYGLKTIIGIQVQHNQAGQWQKINLDLKEVGDADVPEASAVLSGSEIHPIHQHHGSLYIDNDVKMRLKLELTR
jgi:pSer/pThr/pTyr-binding forkhead associated (FHA) protein